MGQSDSQVEAALSVYIATFSARLDAYVRDSHVTVKEPLTPEVARAAFGVGGFSVSGYLADRGPEGSWVTHVGAIDFDTPDGMSQALDVQAMLSMVRVPSLLAESRRGAHLWVLCEQVISARVFRQALTSALRLCGYFLDHIEVFPKASVSEYGVGALRMPLMRHPKSGLRYPVLVNGGQIDRIGPLLLLAASSESPPDALRDLAGPEPDTRDPNVPLRASGTPYAVRRNRDAAPSAVALLETLGVTAVPGRGVRCPFHDDQHASLSVSPDDERVWCHAPACVANNDGAGLGTFDLDNLISKGATRVPGQGDNERLFRRVR